MLHPDRLPITLCLTIGGRPDHLLRTLSSLADRNRLGAVIAINDFGDEATNAVFRASCPEGQLIVPGRRLGHHQAVDELYRCVQTPYVFHCEDDWLFRGAAEWTQAIRLLDRNPEITQVCFRQVEDFGMPDKERAQIRRIEDDGIPYLRLDHAEPCWHGFTFNPHLASLQLWREMGGFSRFQTEWKLSRALRRQGRFVAYLLPGLCSHIGADRSMAAATRPGLWRRWWQRCF